MLIITGSLTVGQITFILRVIIQLFLYGGLFLITLIILGQAPRIATVETHDILNRIVGNSTITVSSFKWIANRVVRGYKDPAPSSLLVLAIFLSLSYGLFASISDIGLIGFSSCVVAGGTFLDFPASVQSMDGARAVIAANMLNGADPSSVNSYRCDSAHDIFIPPSYHTSQRTCTAWHNSTYGDPNDFRRLNTTDSDVLMPKNLAHDSRHFKDGFDSNVYFRGATGQLVSEAVLSGGIAVIPHDTGVNMIVGVPQLTQSQKVFIPKTMALEVEMGCMNLGLHGHKNIGDSDTTTHFFTPNSMYNSTSRDYTGPEYLELTLIRAANTLRDRILPQYNTSDLDPSGYLRVINSSSTTFTWDTEIDQVFLQGIVSNIPAPSDDIVVDCTQEIHQSLNVSYPAASLRQTGKACAIYLLTGSFLVAETPVQGYSHMICASATQLNMVAALVEVGAGGKITANFTRLPSDLNKVEALFDYYVNNLGHEIWNQFDPIQRFTLSDNPNGQPQHFIYQHYQIGVTAVLLANGPGSMGDVLSTVGSTMLGFVSQFDSPLLGVVNPQFFTLNQFKTRPVTRWGGALGASYILGSTGYNAWAALDAEPVTVTLTGGKSATCYDCRYAIAFLPLVLAALFIATWAAVLFFSSRIRGAGKLKEIYGGLAPMMVMATSQPPLRSILLWERDPDVHLQLVMDDTPIVGDAGETLVSYMKGPKPWSGHDSDK